MNAVMLDAFVQGKVRAIVDVMGNARRWQREPGKDPIWTQKKNGYTYRLRIEDALIKLERSHNASKRSAATWEPYRLAAIRDARITPTGLLMPTWSIEL